MPWLPLFPLRTVLFPTMTLPLHIFEPRYREMTEKCLGDGIGFGVVLIRSGEEVGDSAEPHEVGSEAMIVASERLPDGRYNIVVEGRGRFQIHSLDNSRPYLSGEVEPYEDEPEGDGDLLRIAEAVSHLYQGLLQRLDSAGTVWAEESMRELSPDALSWKVAEGLPLPAMAKQQLLESRSARQRLFREADALQRLADMTGVLT